MVTGARVLPDQPHLPLSHSETHREGREKRPVIGMSGRLEPSAASSHVATVFRNTGSGGSLQLIMLPETLQKSAWRQLAVADSGRDRFITMAISQLRLVRDVIAGKRRTITALLGFTGFLLPAGQELRISDGLVRATTEVDRKLVPESLKGQVSASDPSGATIVVNYDGDVVLEYELPLPDTGAGWQHGRPACALATPIPPAASDRTGRETTALQFDAGRRARVPRPACADMASF